MSIEWRQALRKRAHYWDRVERAAAVLWAAGGDDARLDTAIEDAQNLVHAIDRLRAEEEKEEAKGIAYLPALMRGWQEGQR